MFTPSPNKSPARTITTDVDTNAETDAPVNAEAGVRFSKSTLHFDSALHRVNSASKFGEDTIARRIRYAAPVFPQCREPSAVRSVL
jgi:hypothetical protein